MIRSLDGGWTWFRTSVPAEFRLLRRVRFLDRRHGWILGDGRIGATVDGGKTWTVSTLPGNGDSGPTDIAFPGPLRGWLLAHVAAGGEPRSEIFASSDGGLRRRRSDLDHLPIPPEFGPMAGDETTMWASSQYDDRAGCVYRTTDAGRRWDGHFPFGTAYCPPVVAPS